MKSFIKRIFSVFIISIFSLSLLACSNSDPTKTVTSYLDILKKQDLAASTKYLSTQQSTDITQLNNSAEGKIIKNSFSKLSYQIESSSINGNNATVKAKIMSVDFAQLTKSMISNLLPSLISQAFSGNSSSQSEIEGKMVQYLSDEIKNPNVPMTTSEVNINLVKNNNNWLIVPDENLANAVTGNIASLSNAFNSINSQ